MVGKPLRDTAPGMFHVYTHCVWASPAIFRDDVDRLTFLRGLARVTRRLGWTCVAFCLMTTHHHLIVDVDDGMLPRGMHALNWNYAMHFNQRHSMRGHSQFARYGARRIVDDDDLLGVFKYLMRNPVEAALCAAPAEWRWSSYAETIGLAPASSFLDAGPVLRLFEGQREHAIARLRTFVENP